MLDSLVKLDIKALPLRLSLVEFEYCLPPYFTAEPVKDSQLSKWLLQIRQIRNPIINNTGQDSLYMIMH